MVRLTCVLDILFLVLLVAKLSTISSDIGGLNSSIDFQLHLIQVVGLLGGVGIIVAVYNAVQVWRTGSSPVALKRAAVASPEGGSDSPSADSQVAVSGRRWIWTRVSETVIALACIGFTWFAVYWGMLNFNLNF
jgi:hypothetical protein